MECNYEINKTVKGELEVTIEGAKLCLRNFAGNPDDYNPAGGKREFGIMLSEELADILMNEGLEVKRFRPRDDEEIGNPFVKVKVKFLDWDMPNICMYTERNEIVLDENKVARLDKLELEHVDLTIITYPWKYANKTGKAFKVVDLRAIIAPSRARYDDKYLHYREAVEC